MSDFNDYMGGYISQEVTDLKNNLMNFLKTYYKSIWNGNFSNNQYVNGSDEIVKHFYMKTDKDYIEKSEKLRKIRDYNIQILEETDEEIKEDIERKIRDINRYSVIEDGSIPVTSINAEVVEIKKKVVSIDVDERDLTRLGAMSVYKLITDEIDSNIYDKISNLEEVYIKNDKSFFKEVSEAIKSSRSMGNYSIIIPTEVDESFIPSGFHKSVLRSQFMDKYLPSSLLIGDLNGSLVFSIGGISVISDYGLSYDRIIKIRIHLYTDLIQNKLRIIHKMY